MRYKLGTDSNIKILTGVVLSDKICAAGRMIRSSGGLNFLSLWKRETIFVPI